MDSDAFWDIMFDLLGS